MSGFNFYRAQDNWYLRIVRQSDNAIWDETAGAISLGPSYVDSVIVLVWNTLAECYVVDLPDLPVDEYDLLFYNAASPASGDEVLYGQEYNRL